MNEFLNVRTDRLLELADHLEYGKLGHQRFYFGFFNDTPSPRCGTSGCAIGECPILWPDEWRFTRLGDPMLRAERSRGRFLDIWRSVNEWFGLNDTQAGHIFNPFAAYSWQFGGSDLPDTATKEEVAANIRAFVKHAIENGARSPKSWEAEP